MAKRKIIDVEVEVEHITNWIKDYFRARKEYCASLVDTNNGSHFLKWYVEGKNLMRGVKPNQAILQNFRNMWANFPW